MLLIKGPSRVLAGSAVLLAALTACSGGGGGSSSSSTEPSPSHHASTAPSKGAKAATLTIKNFTFTPANLTVAPGTKVTVTNKDTTTHTVTATDKKKSFDTGSVAAGKTTTFTAPSTAGSYPYKCTIHPFMKATLTVK